MRSIASNLTALGFVLLVGGALYASLYFGLAESMRDRFVPPASNSWAEVPPTATRTPLPVPEAPSLLEVTATPVVHAPEPPQGPPNRRDCDAIRGTDYLSVEERSWYLGNCLGAPNRANCDEIRGTQYLSTAERNWYLTFCT